MLTGNKIKLSPTSLRTPETSVYCSHISALSASRLSSSELFLCSSCYMLVSRPSTPLVSFVCRLVCQHPSENAGPRVNVLLRLWSDNREQSWPTLLLILTVLNLVTVMVSSPSVETVSLCGLEVCKHCLFTHAAVKPQLPILFSRSGFFCRSLQNSAFILFSYVFLG